MHCHTLRDRTTMSVLSAVLCFLFFRFCNTFHFRILRRRLRPNLLSSQLSGLRTSNASTFSFILAFYFLREFGFTSLTGLENTIVETANWIRRPPSLPPPLPSPVEGVGDGERWSSFGCLPVEIQSGSPGSDRHGCTRTLAESVNSLTSRGSQLFSAIQVSVGVQRSGLENFVAKCNKKIKIK